MMKQHLLLKSERRTRRADVRADVVNVRRAQMIVNASAQPMDIVVFASKGKSSKGKGKDLACCKCGRKGHMEKDCWSKPCGEGKGANDTKAPVKQSNNQNARGKDPSKKVT